MEKEEDERRAEITRKLDEKEEMKQRKSVFARMTTSFMKDDRTKLGGPDSPEGGTPKSTSGEGSPTNDPNQKSPTDSQGRAKPREGAG